MKTKRILAVTLVVALVAGLTSCGPKKGEELNNERETITVFGGVPARITNPETGLEKSDEAWYKLIEDKNNVNIVVEAPASSNLNERL